MKHVLVVLLLSALCVTLGACGTEGGEAAADSDSNNQNNSDLPEAVPPQFPFPDGAKLRVTTTETAGGNHHVVAFSFSEDADAVYATFKEFAESKGYTIATEGEHRFSATNDSSEGLVVNISDMGSIRTGTVTFSGPTP